jgi:hypothetical protein
MEGGGSAFSGAESARPPTTVDKIEIFKKQMT